MPITSPQLPPKAGYVEIIDADGKHVYKPTAETLAQMAERKRLEESVTAIENAIERGAFTLNTYDALASAIYVSRQTLNGGSIDTDDKRLRASGLYEDWTEGSYQVGDIRNAKGQTWECHAEHDNAEFPDITPDNPQTWANFWRPLHGTSPETARPWVQPRYGTTDIYHAGEYMIWTDGTIQRCKQDTNYSPEEYPQAWEIYSE